jgi:hypothetical protein
MTIGVLERWVWYSTWPTTIILTTTCSEWRWGPPCNLSERSRKVKLTSQLHLVPGDE